MMLCVQSISSDMCRVCVSVFCNILDGFVDVSFTLSALMCEQCRVVGGGFCGT